ncbi:hypothetical protein Pmani_001795 [Petrolisthes manimaculis]|uniref:Uncharacterized protein n=1 Tax=Petrolisthes manimaculis TaxID=1843537 RepID=A0AAE1UJZ5_9EUCA|nr:hypothetical protein Pmani_001795 [Petrolisthes manimaculis]
MSRLASTPTSATDVLTTPVMPAETSLDIHLLNARSYLEHLQDMQADPIVVSTDFFCFVETFPRKGQQLRERELILPGSASFRTDRSATSERGGAMILALHELSPVGDYSPQLVDWSTQPSLSLSQQNMSISSPSTGHHQETLQRSLINCKC